MFNSLAAATSNGGGVPYRTSRRRGLGASRIGASTRSTVAADAGHAGILRRSHHRIDVVPVQTLAESGVSRPRRRCPLAHDAFVSFAFEKRRHGPGGQEFQSLNPPDPVPAAASAESE